MKKSVKDILIYLHQLPQNILGLFLVKILRAEPRYFNNNYKYILIYYTKKKIGISLGKYIIIYKKASNKTKLHEYGHTKQSLKLGWLYLIVIGLPSFTFACYSKIFHSKWDIKKKNKWYHSLPWELWADKLGGVNYK